MALTIGDLVGFIRADDSGMRRGLANAQLRMRSFRRDTESQLRDLHHNFRQASQRAAAGWAQVVQRLQPVGAHLRRIAGMAAGLGGVALSVGKIAAVLGAAVPLAAGLAAALANIAPAAALGVSGIIALQLASGTLKLAMVGVGDAIGAALDPSKAEEFEKALKKLSPNAQAFARQVKAMAPAFDKLRKSVQDRVFAGLNTELASTSKAVLPSLRTALLDTGDTLNHMAKGVGAAARDLSERGILGTALKGATGGLKAFERAPGQVVTALGQIGAAAAPAFQRLSKAGAGALDRLSEKLSRAFETGAMEKAIEQAITLIGDLAEIAGNIFGTIGSIFSAAQASGGGFIGVLKEITGALEAAFKSPEVQAGLRAIFQTMAELAKTVGPLLVDALKVIGPVFAALGPPVQELIRALGAALKPVIQALGPVLAAAALAVGALIEAIAPLLPVIGELVAALLPVLTPLLDAMGQVFKALAPVVQQVATILRDTLTPVIEALTPIIEPLAQLIADQLVFWLGFLGDLLVELSPSLVKLGEALGELLVACAPLIEAFARFATKLLEEIAPYLPGIIAVVGKLAAFLADVLASNITNVLVPALQIVAQLLSGDFSGALDSAKRMAMNMAVRVVETFQTMPGRVSAALSGLASRLGSRMQEAGMRMSVTIANRVTDAVNWVKGLPGRAQSALGNLSLALYKAGRSLIGGFISGILSKVGDVASAASSVVSRARNFFPFSPAKEGPFSGQGWTLYSGQSISEGLAAGIASRAGLVQSSVAGLMAGAQGALGGLTLGPSGLAGGPLGLAPVTAGAAATGGGVQTVRIVVDGPEAVKRLIRTIVQDDGRGNVQTAFGQ